MRSTIILCIMLILPLSALSQDLTSCQCSYKDWVGDCQARVELKNKWFKVISNTQQCSRVDWFIDGNPQVTIVTDGAEMEEWLGNQGSPEVVIQSCKVCRESNFGANNDSKSSAEISEDTILSDLSGKWCRTNWSSGYDIWEVNGNQLTSIGHEGGKAAQWTITITGDKTFRVDGPQGRQKFTLIDRDTMWSKPFLGKRISKKCN